MPKLSNNVAAGLRHAVYTSVLNMLPWASWDQGERVAANLRLDDDWASRFISLHVTPEACTTRPSTYSRAEIEAKMNAVYGDYLGRVSGFYPDRRRFRLNLPRGECALGLYRGPTGHAAGMWCQPLNAIDVVFVLSSAKFGGPRAEAMLPRDRVFFQKG